MRTTEKKQPLEQSKQPFHWLKRKAMIMITALMIGMANGMNMGEDITLKKQNQTELQDKKD
ncbi:hypothetical protein FFWV33_00075 [Flavobacterium faecale]|uniref:Uncharacterized protein n=1 Tax=Flavobacterium faecale TaxID=1355330 RepID=A0A2S1L8F4_9FLAO|nr:hypothetical protein [Flavobacterium faecale]AWG20029.1 hypothetical protein FFWV33_00075 [Flavobacterium faecale]